MEGIGFTARFKIEHTQAGDRYIFFCDLSGAPVYTTDPICEQNPQKAAAIARGLARPHFNRCLACGKWVGDTAYNIDEMKCVACAPCDLPERYCTECGNSVPEGNRFCTRCGREMRKAAKQGLTE